MSFEEQNNRLAEIVDILEKGEVDLDQSTKLFEEAIKIAKELNDSLKLQKGKITELKQVVDKFVEEEMK